MGLEIPRAVSYLIQAQIRRREAQPVARHAHAHGKAGVRNNFYAQGPAAAGALRLAGVSDEAAVHELRQVLIYGRQAQTKRLRKRLPRAEALCLVKAVVYAAARLAPSVCK